MPERYGLRTTPCNRFSRWRAAGVWDHLLGTVSRDYAGELSLSIPPGSAFTNMVPTEKRGISRFLRGQFAWRPPDKPAVNAKRLRRIMGNHVILLESHSAVCKDRADELAVLGASLPLVRYGARSQLAMSAVVNPHAIRLKPPLTDFKRTSECRPSSISPPTEYSVTTKSAARANCVPQSTTLAD